MDVSSATSRPIDYDRHQDETHDDPPRATTTSEAAHEEHTSHADCAALWQAGTAVAVGMIGASVGVMVGPSAPGKLGTAVTLGVAGMTAGGWIGQGLGVKMCAPDAPHASTPATAAPSPKAPAPAPSSTSQSHAPAPAPAAPPADSCSEDPNQIPCATAGAVVIQG